MMTRKFKIKNKLTIILISTALVMLAICVSCSPKNKLSLDINSQNLELIEKNTINVAIAPGYKPWEYAENGELKGFDIDIANMVASSLGLKVNFVQYSFDNLLGEVEKGKETDLAISGITKTDERQQKFNFSNPYYSMEDKLLLITKEGSRINESNINNILQEPNIRVCVAADTGILALQKQYPNINFVKVDMNEINVDYVYDSLNKNIGDIFLADQNYYKLGGDTKNFKIVKTIDWHEDICVIFPKNKTNLLDAVNKVFQAKENEINQLKDKYFNN